MTHHLKIKSAAPISTIQDLGRFGLQRLGITQSGPMDAAAFAIANALLKNEPNAAQIEFAGFGGQYMHHGNTPIQVCVTGADAPISVNKIPQQPYQVITLNAGDTLKIGAVRSGNYGYLALRGGVSVDPVMNSRSTHTRAGFGGRNGQRLQAGDELPAPELPLIEEMTLPLNARPALQGEIRVILGQQSNMFSDETVQQFLTQPYKITNRIDRMGAFLNGVPLAHLDGHDLVSDGIVMGSIQVPGSGQPIVLLADRQPTGGYPKIATIITADLNRFAQLRPNETVQFTAVDLDHATHELARLHNVLNTIQTQFKPVVKSASLQAEALMKSNLISGVISDD